MRPIVVSIAGSDPSGGAGIQADLKTLEACGAWGATVVTAITAQNTVGVRGCFPLPPDVVREQWNAIVSDLSVRAVKSGMLANAVIVHAVADALRKSFDGPYVLDPVLAASDGTPLLEATAVDVLRSELFPQATLITPNAEEAAQLTGMDVADLDQARRAGRELRRQGARAVLIKGGHLERDRGTDLLLADGLEQTFNGEWIDTPQTHGSGCVYASAIAGRLALGDGAVDAIAWARRFVTEAIRRGRA